MSWAAKILGLAGIQADVDANNNLKVVQPKVLSQAGYGVLITELDAGAATGTPYRLSPITSDNSRLEVGTDTVLFDYKFTAAAQDTGVWSYTSSTMTCTQGSGNVLFNAISTTTASVGCSLRSWRTFSLNQGGVMEIGVNGQITAAPIAGQMLEMGWAVPTTTTQPTDGAWFQFSNAGLYGVLAYAGAPSSIGPFNLAPFGGTIPANTTMVGQIRVSQYSVEFWVNETLMGEIALPVALATAFMTQALPVFCQMRNIGAITGSPQLQFKWGASTVIQREVNIGMASGHLQGAMGLHGYQGLAGGTMGSSASYANSQAAGAGTALLNAATLATGLGGQAAILPTLVVGTDGIVTSWQNPAIATGQMPRVFMCTGVKIHGAVTTTLTGGAVLYAYSLAFGHTAVSMATAETGSFTTATTKLPRRIPIGYETYASGAAVGVLGSPSGIDADFSAAPFPINPGEFLAVCAKNQGVVTTLGVITVLVEIRGYFI